MLGHRTLNVEDYLSILKRRWWIVLSFAVVFLVAGFGATYMVTPQFVSETLVLIDQQKVPTDIVQPVATQALDSRLAYITEQILSRSSIQPIIEKYNLYGNQRLAMEDRVDRVKKDLKIEAVHSDIARANGLPGFRIGFTASDPQTAQQVCGEITSLFTKNNLQARQASAEGTSDFLKEQLAVATQNLNDLDAKVADFQHKYAGMLPEDQTNNMSIMASLNSELDATTQQLQNLEQNKSVGQALLTQQQAAQAAAALPSAVPVQTTQTQQKEYDDLLARKADLETRYSPDYPDVKDVNRKISDLQKQMAKSTSAPAPTASASSVKVPDSASITQLKAQLNGWDQQIVNKRKQQDSIQQQIRGYEGRISMSPQVEAQYKELTRDYDTAEAFQKRILQAMNNSEMTTSLENREQGETFSVLDAPSLPTEAIFPRRSYFSLGGLAAGFTFGLLFVALLEYRDTALRTERDIWDFTQLPTLAVVAWSGDIASEPVTTSRLKRLFRRKPSGDLLADSTG